MIKIIEFNKNKYPFDKMVSELYDVPLSTLNDNLDHTGGDLGMDTDSKWHTKFYDKLRKGWPEFISTYEKFIVKNIIPKSTKAVCPIPRIIIFFFLFIKNTIH